MKKKDRETLQRIEALLQRLIDQRDGSSDQWAASLDEYTKATREEVAKLAKVADVPTYLIDGEVKGDTLHIDVPDPRMLNGELHVNVDQGWGRPDYGVKVPGYTPAGLVENNGTSIGKAAEKQEEPDPNPVHWDARQLPPLVVGGGGPADETPSHGIAPAQSGDVLDDLWFGTPKPLTTGTRVEITGPTYFGATSYIGKQGEVIKPYTAHTPKDHLVVRVDADRSRRWVHQKYLQPVPVDINVDRIEDVAYG